MWIIYNKTKRLWWSNREGWVDRASATRFSTTEKRSFNYIPGTGSKWVKA